MPNPLKRAKSTEQAKQSKDKGPKAPSKPHPLDPPGCKDPKAKGKKSNGY